MGIEKVLISLHNQAKSIVGGELPISDHGLYLSVARNVADEMLRLEAENAKLFNALAQILTLHEPCTSISYDRHFEILEDARRVLEDSEGCLPKQ